MSVAEQLAWEARRRPVAVIAALIGALLPIIVLALSAVLPRTKRDDDRARLLYLHEHAGALTLGSVLLALGLLAAGVVLFYLARATRAREPRLPALAGWLALAGPLLLAVGLVAQRIILAGQAADYVKRSFPDPGAAERAATKALEVGSLGVSQALGLSGQLLLTLAFVLICFNAMRAGLLTRFMGVFGILIGAFGLLAPQLAVLQSLWLGALVALFLGRWPGGQPPAWRSGQAVPWPSRPPARERVGRARAPAPAADGRPATARSPEKQGGEDAKAPVVAPAPTGAPQAEVPGSRGMQEGAPQAEVPGSRGMQEGARQAEVPSSSEVQAALGRAKRKRRRRA